MIPNYEKERLDINITNELGSYDVYVNDDFFTAFSTNISKFESPKIRANLNEVVNSFQSKNASILLEKQGIVESIKSQRHGKSLWRIFLIISISLFLIESIISRPTQKEPSN